MTHAPEEHETILIGLVEEAMRRQERGEKFELGALCEGWPHLEIPLREALGLCERLDSLEVGDRPDQQDSLVGKVLGGRYELRRRIGMGAMGAVFEGRDLVLSRTVAIKVLDPVLFRADAGRERFSREARAVAALKHPGIVVIHDHGGGELPFLVMDLVEGVDLAALLAALSRRAAQEGARERIRGGWFGDAFRQIAAPAIAERVERSAWDHSYALVVAKIVLQVARALAAAHAQGVLHRDVKPSNILLLPDGKAVLVDFGLARLPGERTLTRGAGPLGTPWYMAPEQASGAAHAVSHAADLYALGSTLYHLIALRPPFEDEPARVLVRIQQEDPVPLRKLVPAAPRDLALICEKAMEKRPADRYGCAAEMASDLEAFLDLRAISVSPPSLFTKFARRVRRRPARAAAIALLAVLIPVGISAWVSAGSARRFQEELVVADRRRRAFDLLRTVPPLVCVEGDPRRNLLELNAKDTESLALLSEILELDPGQALTRLLRATLLLDSGRTSDGLADLRVLQSQVPGSSGLGELIARLERVGPGLLWSVQVPIDPPPAATTALDHFVLGFGYLRASKGGSPELARRSLAALDRALELDPRMHEARDLRLLAHLMNDRWNDALGEAHYLEGVYGRSTARTRHVIAAAHLMLKQPRLAVPAAEESLRLRPGRHGPLHNLGTALFKLGEYGKALACLQEAAVLRPELYNTAEMLARTLRALRRFDEALAAAERIPTDTPQGKWRHALHAGNVYLDQAILARGQGDVAKARELCVRARPFIAEARALAPQRLEVKTSEIYVRHLGEEDLAGALGPMLDLINQAEDEDPMNLWCVGIMLFSVPGTDPKVALSFLHRAHKAARADRDAAYWLAKKLLEHEQAADAARVLLETLDGIPLEKEEAALVREVLRALPPEHQACEELRSLELRSPTARPAASTSNETTPTPMSQR